MKNFLLAFLLLFSLSGVMSSCEDESFGEALQQGQSQNADGVNDDDDDGINDDDDDDDGINDDDDDGINDDDDDDDDDN